MLRLEHLRRGSLVRGVVPGQNVTVLDVRWHGSTCVELTYKDEVGNPGNTLLYRDDEPRLELVTGSYLCSLDGDGHLFRLAAEATIH